MSGTGEPTQAPTWWAVSAAYTLDALDTSRSGLTSAEAAHRRVEYGPNAIADVPTPSVLVVFVRQFVSPLIAILLLAAAVTAALREWTDTAVIAAVLLLNAVIGTVQERKADSAVRALMRMAGPRALVLRDGAETEIDGRDVVPGDLVLLESGDRVPADLRLITVNALHVDESLLTGESAAVVKHTRPVHGDVALADRGSLAFAGTTVARGRAAGVVVATGAQTELGHVATLIRAEPEQPTPLKRRMDQLARIIGIAVTASCIAVFAVGLLRGGSVADLFLAAVALAVAAVPEGLPIVLTIALALGVTRMARRHAIIRRLPAVEALGSATVIGSDKTGTLTQNRMTARTVWAAGTTVEVDGTRATAESVALGPAARVTLLAGALTNEASWHPAAEAESRGDPTEVALLRAAAGSGLVPDLLRDRYPLVAEKPFEPSTRYSAAVRRDGTREVVFVKGAPEHVLDMCDTMLGDDGDVALDHAFVHAAARAMASSGLRVLGMAVSSAHSGASPPSVESPQGLVFAGLVGLMDPPRPGVVDAVAACRDAGLRVVMITGDHAVTAAAIAAELGIETGQGVLTGTELERLDETGLRHAVRTHGVFARISPVGKLRIVRALQADGEIVAVTGDGVNDAPALRAASIGVAMGEQGTDVAREAAEIVVSDDNFVTIVSAVEEGRITFENVRRATFFLLSTAVAEIVALFAGVAAGWPLLMLPAQLLWLNLITNGLQDVALAFERGERNVLARPPRDPREGVLSPALWWRTATTGLVMALGTLVMFRWELGQGGSPQAARTVALTTMVVFMAFQAGNARSDRRSVFAVPLRDNPFLVIATAATFGVHVGALYLPFTQTVLRVEPLDATAWVRIVAVAASVLVVVELEKAIGSRHPAANWPRAPGAPRHARQPRRGRSWS